MAAPRPSLPPGTGLLWFETLDSTNEEARRRAAGGVTEPVWIVAERQTKGRGRQGRAWETAPGNLAATYLFAPGLAPPEAARLSFAAALAAADLIDSYLPRAARMKWPNDVLVRERKIAGILLESAAGQGSVAWLAIGVGVNLADHPQGTAFPATALTAEGVAAPPVGEVVERLAVALGHWLGRHAREGFEPIRNAWLARGPALGTSMTVRSGHETVEGRFAGLGADGALQLSGTDGRMHRISAGDVFLDNGGTSLPHRQRPL